MLLSENLNISLTNGLRAMNRDWLRFMCVHNARYMLELSTSSAVEHHHVSQITLRIRISEYKPPFSPSSIFSFFLDEILNSLRKQTTVEIIALTNYKKKLE